jgi:DNA-binding transcriptional ArsR family regulator
VIADTIGAPHNTLSTHLAILVRAGLLRSSREGRTIIYRSDGGPWRTWIRNRGVGSSGKDH